MTRRVRRTWTWRLKNLYVYGRVGLEQFELLVAEALEHGDPEWDASAPDGMPPWRIRYGGVWRDARLPPV